MAAIEAIKDAVLKLSTQYEEVIVHLVEIKESITKQRNDALLDRITRMEQSLKESHIKLDTISSIDINPTIEAPRPAAVRVAGAKKKAAEDKKDDDTKVEEEESYQNTNITEYFKLAWIKYRQQLYDKNVYSEKELETLMTENKEMFDKKKGNDVVLQRSIASKIWRSLSKERKDIVYSMKNENANAINKKASKDVEVEVEPDVDDTPAKVEKEGKAEKVENEEKEENDAKEEDADVPKPKKTLRKANVVDDTENTEAVPTPKKTVRKAKVVDDPPAKDVEKKVDDVEDTPQPKKFVRKVKKVVDE